MPTVPIIFTYANRVRPGLPSSSRTDNPWSLRGGTLHDEDGNPVVVSKSGSGGTYDLGPFSFDFDPATLWGAGAHKEDADPSYFTATLTYPDEWHETYFAFDIRVDNYISTSNYGWVTYFNSAELGNNIDLFNDSPEIVEPEPEITELLPTEAPISIEMTLGESATDTTFALRSYPPFTEAGAFTGFSDDKYLIIRNRSYASLTASGDIMVDWGVGGDVDTYSFTYSLPAVTIDETFSPGSKSQYWVTRVPCLRIRTDPDISTPSAATVIVNNANYYVAEIRVPRSSHDYTATGNPDPVMYAETSNGNTWHLARDPRPIANFGPVDEDDLTELETLRLDASRSFDLTDDVGVYLWWIQPYIEGNSAPQEPPFYTTPTVISASSLLEQPDTAPGLYAVFLAVAVGSVTPGEGRGFEYEREQQVSYFRRKDVYVTGAGGERFGSFIDQHGTLYTAVNDSTSVVVSRSKQGTSSREILSTLTEARNASMYLNDSRHIRLGYTDRDTGDFVAVTSADDGAVFS